MTITRVIEPLRPNRANEIREMETWSVFANALFYGVLTAVGYGLIRFGVYYQLPSPVQAFVLIGVMAAFVFTVPGALELLNRGVMWWETRSYRRSQDR